MALAGRVIVQYLVLEALEIEPGYWCPRCQVSSAAKVALVSQVAINGEVQPLKLSTGWRCLDEERWIPEPTA